MKNEKYKLVVPTIPSDVDKIMMNIFIYFENLPISDIYIIGSKDVKEKLPVHDHIFFYDEKLLVDIDKIKKIIISRTGREQDGKRAGWYVQQFIKMEFSKICGDEFYLLWDSDTLPVKKIELFHNDLPFFDCKSEHHKAYFDTIEKILPGYQKNLKGSFIAEHMLIKTEYMKKLISDIEVNTKISGSDYQEKLMNAINQSDLAGSGFSEFETYGTYVMKKFSESYEIRKWKSMRYGGYFFLSNKRMSAEDMRWLAKYYSAVSFEKKHYITAWSKIIEKSWFKVWFPPGILEGFALFARVKTKFVSKVRKYLCK